MLGNGRPARKPPETTYLSELLGTGPGSPPLEPPEPEPRPFFLTVAFGLVAAAALVVCGLLMYDVLWPGDLSSMLLRDSSAATRTGLSSCSVPEPAASAGRHDLARCPSPR